MGSMLSSKIETVNFELYFKVLELKRTDCVGKTQCFENHGIAQI